MESPIRIIQKQFIPVDNWEPEPEDMIFNHIKGFIIAPLSQIYYCDNSSSFDYFKISSKKCFNRDDLRAHTVKYLNYFEKFYDSDHELIMIYAQIKYLIDFVEGYSREAFLYDIRRYILSPSIIYKVTRMNRDNYCLEVSKNYSKNKIPSLQYNNKHAYILMKISLLINIMIPVLTHFISKNKIPTDDLLLEAYDSLMQIFDVDIYSKLYETSISNITKRKNSHPIWEKQDIRGTNITLHAMDTVNNIILNIMPKYVYNENIICFNFRSILRTLGYAITDINFIRRVI